MRKRRTKVTLLGAPLSQEKKIEGLTKSFPETRILTYAGTGEVYTTSRSLRDKGVVICSECGYICCDSQEKCPSCSNEVIAILDDLPKSDIEPEPIRKFIKTLIN